MASRIIRRFRDLVDVTFGSPSDGDVVSYDAASDKLILSASAGGGATTLLDLTDVAGTDGAGKAPVSDGADTFTLTDIATQAELDTHAADTTSVHGITDTSALETTTGSQSKADAAETAAEAYTDTSVAALSSVYQPLDSDLTAIAALTTTTFGRALLALADAAALRSAAALGTAATSATTDFDAAGAATTAQTTAEGYTDTSISALSSVYQPLDTDLTAVAGLTPTNDDVIQRKAGAWTNRTMAQLISDLAALGTTFQPLDSDLTSIAALATTSYGRTLLTLANAAAADWIPSTYLDTDGTLAADSDTKVATQKATKTYVDANAGGGGLPVLNVEDYGAVHDGTTDDATAINNAIAALPTTGGIVYFPAGNYAVASTINIGNGTSSALSTRQGIYLLGAAGPVVIGQAAVGLTTYGAVQLKWTGSAAGTVVSVNGPLVGWGLKNLFISGSSSANYGLLVQSAQGGTIENLAVHGCKAANINSTPVASFSGIATNTMHNDWRNIFLALPTIAGTTRALFLAGTASTNTSFERFTNLSINVSDPGSGNTVTAIVFRECDNITISGLHFSCAANAGTYYPLYFNYSGATATQPADNLIEHVDFGAHYTTVVGQTGTPSGSFENKVVAIGGSNSGGVPSDPALANLAWGYTAANP